MCGRYSLVPDELSEIRIRFQVEFSFKLHARYNIAPSQDAPIIRQNDDGNRKLVMAQWGIIPRWAKDTKGFSNINARAESVATKPAYRDAFQSRRCLVPASGFYEWQRVKGQRKKQPHYIRPNDASLFAFAGLWERWERQDQVIETFTIITTDSNDLVSPIHDRMPVILEPDTYDVWLEPETPLSALDAVMRPMASEKMDEHTVSAFVNDPAHDSRDCIEVAESPRQGELF